MNIIFSSTKKQNLKPDKLPKPAQLGKLQILKLVKLRSQTQKTRKTAKTGGTTGFSTEPQHTRLSLRTVTAGWSMHQWIVLGALRRLRASPVRRLSGRGLWRQGQRVERVRDVGLEPARCKARPSSPCDTRGAAPDNPFCCFYYTRDAVV